MKTFEMELVGTKRLEISKVQGGNSECDLEYYVISTEADNSVRYGIQISMLKENGENETVILPDVFVSKPNVAALANSLYLNSVTPVSAYDIVYDYIA